MTQVHSAGSQAGIDPSANIHTERAGDAEETQAKGAAEEAQATGAAEEAAQAQQPPSTAETAEKVDQTAGDEGESYFSFADDFTGSVSNSTSTFFSDVRGTIVHFTDQASEALSLESLQGTGAAAIDGVGNFISDTCETVRTSTPVETVSAWISDGAEAIGNGADSTGKFTRTNWLPVSIVALSIFTAVKSAQAAKENFKAGDLKKSVMQICVGAAAAVLAGSVINQTGAVQAAGTRFGNLFSSESGE